MRHVRSAALIGAALLGLAACTLPPNLGYTPTRADATAFDRAKSICFERGYGGLVSSPGADSAHEAAFRACMAEMGWQPPTTMF